MDRPRITI